MRSIVKERGSKNLVYVDESGFEEHTYRPYAWSIRGKKSYGERCGSKGVRTNLIAAKRQKELLAPILYETSTTAEWFNEWLENHLIKELCPQSTIIMDNARFHKKEKVRDILGKAGHTALFLPPYSPDFNPIEQSFAILKKIRTYAERGTSLDDIINKYGSFLE